MAVWRLTGVELASAVMRLRREGRIADAQANEAESRIDELMQSSHVIIDVDAVQSQTRRLLGLHPLRAADALQLGATWEWAGVGSAVPYLRRSARARRPARRFPGRPGGGEKGRGRSGSKPLD